MIKPNTKPQREFTPYDRDVLPQHFSYPARYEALARGVDFPSVCHWWFTNGPSNAGQLAWSLRTHWQEEGYGGLSEIDPIPFARNGDYAAFFDGATTGGDTPVFVVDLGNKAHDRRYPDFDAWLKEVSGG